MPEKSTFQKMKPAIKVLNPSNLASDLEIAQMNAILKSEIKANQKHISKKQVFNLPNFPSLQLTHSLMCFNDTFYALDEVAGTGSGKTKVKVLPVAFKKDAQGNFYPVKETNMVVKKLQLDQFTENAIIEAHHDLWQKTPLNQRKAFLWQKFKEQAQHEVTMLQKSGDKNAALIIEETDDKNSIFISSTRAPGISLEDYLTKNDLSLEQRIHLIRLISDKVEELHKRDISHLDLKLNNIYYDKTTDHITLIDFGSTQENIADLSQVPKNLHTTTPAYDPPCHDKNKPQQISSTTLNRLRLIQHITWNSNDLM